MTSVAAFPGSYNPPTVAHLAMAEATVRQCGVDRGRPGAVADGARQGVRWCDPTVDERAEVLRAVAATPAVARRRRDRRQLLADIADGYDVLVLGADKWEQVLDPAFYGDSVDAMQAAVARLPRLAVAPTEGPRRCRPARS